MLSFRDSFEVKKLQSWKVLIITKLHADGFLRESNKKWLSDGRSNLADASTSRSIGRDAGVARQSASLKLWRSSRVTTLTACLKWYQKP